MVNSKNWFERNKKKKNVPIINTNQCNLYFLETILVQAVLHVTDC